MVNPYIKILGLVAAILGILQGITWTILPIFVILIYSKAWDPEILPESYGSTLNAVFVETYLNADVSIKNVIVNSTVLLAFSIIYLILSLIWLTLSGHLYMTLSGSKFQTVQRSFQLWAGITLLTCLIDAILFSLLAKDYNYIVGSVDLQYSGCLYLITAAGILMTMAIKGYVLWVLNVGLAVALIISSRTMLAEQPPMIYHTAAPSPSTFNQPIEGTTNPAFTPEEEKPRVPYPKPTPYLKLNPAPKPTPLPKPYHPSQLPQQQQPQQTPFNYAPNDRFAKIGPTSKSPPPLHIAPPKVPNSYVYPSEPRVPSPDYSPPSSPFNSQLKSALKNRPNYGRY